MFKFLWSGIEGRKHIHLCRWEHLENPKQLGGWGIQNIHLFNRALATNSLWRVLKKDGVRSKIIKDKYIPHCSMITWFRVASPSNSSASQAWKSILKSLHLLTHRLGWKPGSGHCVQVGLDFFMGLGHSSFLSSQLWDELRRNSVLYLFQARGLERAGITSSYWKSGEELGLVGNNAEEWEAYQKAMCYARIQLQNKIDELIWAGGDSTERISAKNIYLALAKTFWPNPVGGWHEHIWKWDLIPKINLFLWLSLENRILTWDNLQRKGW